MIFSTFRGRFASFQADLHVDEADLTRSSAVVTVDPKSFHTGVESFDAHLQAPEFFDSETYPEVRFETTGIEPAGAVNYRILGALTIKGVTKDIVLEGSMHGPLTDSFGRTRAGLSVQGTVNRSDFGMGWNLPFGEGGVYISDAVSLTIELEATKAE
jgi:polyisoprenoid-binding protein YceI